MKFSNIEIGNLCELVNGRAFKPTEWCDKGLPIIRIQNLNDETKVFNYYNGPIEEKYFVKNGDLLFSWSGTPGTSFGAFFWNRGDAVLNQHIFNVKLKKKLAYDLYLKIALNNTLQYIINQSHGGVGLKHITKGNLEAVQIPLPSYHDQIRIATVLTRAEKLIAKRKESIKALDELVKSTFLEMFGDPVRNEKGWEKKRIDEIADTRLGKMRDKQYITGNYLKFYIGNSNVRWFTFDFDMLEQMDFDENEQIKFSLEYGDLLVCEGGEIGRCAIWKCKKTDVYFQKALHRVRVNKKIIRQEYLEYVFYFYSLWNGFKNVTSKATIAHLTGEKLKETIIPIPPLQLQNQFAAIVEKIETLKVKYTQSLTELENLYGSLSQRAFKGELDLSGVVVNHEIIEKGIIS